MISEVASLARIMIVVDETAMAARLAEGLVAIGQASSWVLDSASEALAQAQLDPPDLVILDLRAEGAIDVAMALRERWRAPVLFIVGDDDDDDDATLERAKLAIPAGYLRRRATPRELRQTLELALHIVRVEDERRRCEERCSRAEEELELQRHYLRTLLENVPDYIYFKDRERRFVLASNSFCGLLKLDMGEILGKRDEDLFPPEVAALTIVDDLQVIDDGQPIINREEGSEEISGSPVWVLSTKLPWRDQGGEIVGLFGISRLITERKKADEERIELERQLVQAQKLESLGVLAGGIAHDFSNLLLGVLGHVDLALLSLSPLAPQHRHLQRIAQISTHAADLCRQMLAYSGRGCFVTEPVDLSALIEEVAKLHSASSSKRAELRLELCSGLPMVEVDAAQIRQVFTSLLANAAESLADGRGTITVKTGVVDGEGRRLDGGDVAYSEGSMVFFEVTDTGCGMDETIQAKLFEPFFTTKFTGRGLGMSAVQGIIRGHRGRIDVVSEPGQGSTLTVLLPGSEAHPDQRLAEEQREARPRPRPRPRPRTVLVVDDEATAREVACCMLEALGFEVCQARDGHDALEHLRHNVVDLVLLDLTMPRMNGAETFREMRRLGIAPPVILSSAFAEAEAEEYVRSEGFADFIQKPYRMTELDEKVRQIVGYGAAARRS